MLYGFVQYRIIEGFGKREFVAAKLIIHILRHIHADRLTVFCLQVIEDNLFAVAHHLLYQQTLHFGCGVHLNGKGYIIG